MSKGQAARLQDPMGSLEDHNLHLRPALRRLGRALVLEGPMTGDAFRVYIEKVLVPTLSPGDTVIIDNLASHKVTGVREAIEAVGATLLYLPPYSPDLNPIELAFAKFKTGLRKAAERTVDDLWRRIGVLIDDFSPQECQNYLCHDGYASA